MVVEKNNGEFLIRINANIPIKKIEKILDYIRYIEIAHKSKAKKTDLNKIVSEVKNKRNFI
ncbi:MAG: hypothetical protein ACK4K9_11130 [Bacteroidia bacterium]